MAISNASAKMNEYVKSRYSDSKSDLFAVFIERCNEYTVANGYQAMITQHAWMFLASFEKLREKLIGINAINMAHLGPRAFEEIGGEVVQTSSFVYRNAHIKRYISTYCRVVEPTTQQAKETEFLLGNNRFYAIQDDFPIIPGGPVAYWIGKALVKTYENPLLSSIAFSDGQILTGNNNKYLRMLWEVDATTVGCDGQWCLHAKGGEYRRWYGNIDTVVSWSKASRKHYREDKIARFPKPEILFRRGITWTLVSMNPNFGVRELDSTLTFNKAAATILFQNEKLIDYVIGLLNSKVAQLLLKIINPTMNNNIKDILNMPYIYSEKNCCEIEALVQENISISKQDWDSFETSWRFRIHPLIQPGMSIQKAFEIWAAECNNRFKKLKSNEERLNELFIDIYGLYDEATPNVEDDTITVSKADRKRDVKSLISYAVGCMFGRYSLDETGLAYGGGEWDDNKYKLFPADKDNIIPICDDQYFKDDIVGRFVKFIDIVYGHETLKANLQYIADTLGGKGHPEEVIRNYFINEFYADHLKIYQKRPIYWLFDSGKKNGFKALMYIHRYQSDTIARIRTDYVHEQQGRYRTAIADLEQRVASASTSDRVKLNKRLSALQRQADEIHSYEEKVHHLADQMIHIDIDDGVKQSYETFKDVLAKI